MTGDQAELWGCFFDDGVAYDVESGAILDARYGARHFLGEARLVDGSWRYEGYRTERAIEGALSCLGG